MMPHKIFVAQQNNIYIVDHHDILYCQSDNCYTFIYTTDGKKLIVVKSLVKFFKEQLMSEEFIRVSQSYVINRNYVRSIDKKHRNIALANEHTVPFSVTIKQLLLLLNGATID